VTLSPLEKNLLYRWRRIPDRHESLSYHESHRNFVDSLPVVMGMRRKSLPCWHYEPITGYL
jgi:hypothetical protein